MSKTKKTFLALLLVSWFLPFLNAGEEKRSSLYYVKLGITHPPGDSAAILPTLGFGARFQRDSYGFDLSANLSSVVFAALKGVFLFYPRPEKKHQLYVGIGPGIGYHLISVPIGGRFRGASYDCGNVTLEGIVGYEFRHARYFKTFIQLELSQPAFGFGKHGRRCGHKPGVALTGGIGF